MTFTVKLTAATFVAGAIVAMVVMTVAWRRRESPGGYALFGMMVGVWAWSVPAALELLSASVPERVILSKMSYLGIMAVPIAYLVFALQVTLSETRRWLAATAVISIPAAAFLGMVFTNEWHGLVWPNLTFDAERGLVIYDHGPAFFALFGYLAAMAIVGSALLLINTWHTQGPYRAQAVAVIAAAVLPLGTTSLYAAGVSPLPDVDLTPGAFAVAGLLLALGLKRYRMLDIVPVAKSRLFDRMTDAVFIVDQHRRVVEVNPAAASLFDQGVATVGAPVGAPVDGWLEAAGEGEEHGTIELQASYGARRLDVRVAPVLGTGRRDGGSLILVRDVTQQRQTEQELVDAQKALHTRLHELEQAQTDVRALEGQLPICSFCKRVRTDKEHWQHIDIYLTSHSNLRFSHAICPTCYPRVGQGETGPAQAKDAVRSPDEAAPRDGR